VNREKAGNGTIASNSDEGGPDAKV